MDSIFQNRRRLPNDCAIDLDKVKVNWKGKTAEGKAHPVKIALQSKEQVRQVLRVKPRDSNVWFKPDLTRMQRDKLKEIRKELNSRQEAGENNLIIKYNFGEPYIDKKNNFRRGQPRIIMN